jgi:hypothetical protein
MADDEAKKHETYFYTQKDMKTMETNIDSYAKMKKVADYDRLRADAHPGDKKFEAAAARSEKQAQGYYEKKGIGGFAYWANEPDGQGGTFYEAKRQGRTPVEPGPHGTPYDAERAAVKLAERAEKLHGNGERWGHLSNTTLMEGVKDDRGNPTPLDKEANVLLNDKAIEKMRTENNREAVLAGVREDAAHKGPAAPAHAHAGR